MCCFFFFWLLSAKGYFLVVFRVFVSHQGQEDQAEETLLKLIRDPYNLADASWTPDSAAETAEWRRLEVHQRRIKHKHLKDVMAVSKAYLHAMYCCCHSVLGGWA